ncbi:hypothetical protein HYH02_006975 [Chlamydomonas schloesseri]|uniref:Uncharacterized protein n=1 Tax=Chlamydomonas schloesseri TaxID=2026947 RepID=A0A835WHZ0_9CHLO|nr:hypothetical protein HYH02_006975 [Chlamydomonas schloesseri]|eukprot:KAG2447944.1 hypothetical protein HYH02_006975 [Chlamydomonas schloesseri]
MGSAKSSIALKCGSLHTFNVSLTYRGGRHGGTAFEPARYRLGVWPQRMKRKPRVVLAAEVQVVTCLPKELAVVLAPLPPSGSGSGSWSWPAGRYLLAQHRVACGCRPCREAQGYEVEDDEDEGEGEVEVEVEARDQANEEETEQDPANEGREGGEADADEERLDDQVEEAEAVGVARADRDNHLAAAAATAAATATATTTVAAAAAGAGGPASGPLRRYQRRLRLGERGGFWAPHRWVEHAAGVRMGGGRQPAGVPQLRSEDWIRFWVPLGRSAAAAAAGRSRQQQGPAAAGACERDDGSAARQHVIQLTVSELCHELGGCGYTWQHRKPLPPPPPPQL